MRGPSLTFRICCQFWVQHIVNLRVDSKSNPQLLIDSSGTRLEVVIGACVGALVIAVLLVAVACFLAKKKREKNQRLVNNHHWQSPPMRGDAASSDSSKLSQACWACDWTKRRQGRGRTGLKRPKKPIIKSDIRVNTLTVTGKMPSALILQCFGETSTM